MTTRYFTEVIVKGPGPADAVKPAGAAEVQGGGSRGRAGRHRDHQEAGEEASEVETEEVEIEGMKQISRML